MNNSAMHSALLNIACLVIGFVIGRLTRTVDRMAADKIINTVPEGKAVNRKRPKLRLRFEHYIAAFLVALGLFTAANSLYQARQNRRNVDCVRAYADYFADAIDARSSTSTSAQKANDELWTTIGKLIAGGQAGPDSRQQFNAALSDFLRKRAEQTEQQQRNPYPPPPRDLCK